MKTVISAIILAKDSETTIEKTLQSLTWCDELIVIDDDSSDGTVLLAKKAGATVYIHKSNDDFAAQRNWAMEKAKGEWILFVDSDEVVSSELASEISSVIPAAEPGSSQIKTWIPGQARNDNVINGYYVKRRDYLFGRWLNHGETGRVRLLRLAKKGSGKWIRPVHEVWNVRGETGELSHPILHYPHPNVAQFIEVINRYSTLNARYLKSQGIHASWWHIIVYPKAKFFMDYIWYFGFLDGTPGAVVAIMMSFHSFLTRAKLYLLWKKT